MIFKTVEYERTILCMQGHLWDSATCLANINTPAYKTLQYIKHKMTEISKIITGCSVRSGIPVAGGDHPNTIPPVMFSISHHMIYLFCIWWIVVRALCPLFQTPSSSEHSSLCCSNFSTSARFIPVGVSRKSCWHVDCSSSGVVTELNRLSCIQ